MFMKCDALLPLTTVLVWSGKIQIFQTNFIHLLTTLGLGVLLYLAASVLEMSEIMKVESDAGSVCNSLLTCHSSVGPSYERHRTYQV